MSSSKKKKIAIITGASAGLGKEFSLQIERRYFCDEIWLIARREEALHALAKQFNKSKGIPLCLDLTKTADMRALEKRLQSEGVEVIMLVNNAGYGKVGSFEKLGLQEQIAMIDLNTRALTELTYLCLPYMNSGSNIIQVASSIAFAPAPYFAVYAATKSFVLSFSSALNYELRPRGIHVISVCPGPVETEFQSVAYKTQAGNNSHGVPFNAKLMAQPQEVVHRALKDLEKKRMNSIFGFSIKFLALAARFLPKEMAMQILAKGRKKELT